MRSFSSEMVNIENEFFHCNEYWNQLCYWSQAALRLTNTQKEIAENDNGEWNSKLAAVPNVLAHYEHPTAADAHLQDNCAREHA